MTRADGHADGHAEGVAGKTPAQTAQEEVLEETGYAVQVEQLRPVASFRSGVGVSGSLQYLFRCDVTDDQRVAAGGGVEDEAIEVVEVGREEARALICRRDEECSESRSAALLFALSWFFGERDRAAAVKAGGQE